jgi:iron complex outermembrane recepter protein
VKQLILFTAFFIICFSHSLAQSLFNLRGEVKDEHGILLPGATVFIHEIQIGTVSNQDGKFEFYKIKPGAYHLHVQYTGYTAAVRNFKIDNQDLFLSITIKQSSIELKTFIMEESTLKIEEEATSVTIEVINQEYIQKNISNSFAKTLEKLPGINTISMGSGIAKPVIRGMSFNRVAVAENGIKQEGQQWGADHGLEIDPYNVDRVEIIKGPASLIFGSDAMAGVINIRPPLLPKENSFLSSVLLTGATNNDLVGTSIMAAGNKNGNIFRLRYSHQDYGDIRVPAERFTYNGFLLPIENGRLKNTAGNERNFSATSGVIRNWGYSTITFNSFNQRAGLFPGAHGIPRAFQLRHDGDFRNIDIPSQITRHLKVTSNSNILWKKNWLVVDIGAQQNHRQELSLPHLHGLGPRPASNIEHDLLLSTVSSNIRYNINKNDKTNIIYGISGSYQQHRQGGFHFLLPDFTLGNVGVFYFKRHEIKPGVHLNGGLRYDHHTLFINRFEEPVYADSETISGYNLIVDNISRTYNNFSGGAGVSLVSSEFVNWKINLGSSYRIPTPNELSANGVHHGMFRHEMGDSTLLPERGYQLDLAYIYHQPDFVFSVTPFFWYFANYIFLTPTAQFSRLPEAGQLYRFRQSEAILSGGEVKADYHINKNLHTGVTGELVFAHNLTDGYPLPFTPPFAVEFESGYEMEIEKRIESFFVNCSYKIFAPQTLTARNEPSTPGYSIINVAAGLNIKLGQQKMQVFFHINNLTNNRYMHHLSRYRILNLPEPGRNFRFTLIIPFQST